MGRLCEAVRKRRRAQPQKKMNLFDLKVIFKNNELVFLDKDYRFIFALGFSGDIEKVQEVFHENPQRIKFIFSLFPFGIGIWDLSTNQKLGVILIRLW